MSKSTEKIQTAAAKAGKTKTNHKTGYHKPIKNPTTNCAPDSHKEFCKRCVTYNGGCPDKVRKSRCSL